MAARTGSPGGIALAVSPINLHDALPGNDADPVRPGGPRLGELGDDVRALGRLIVELGTVDVDVVELPR